MALSPLRSSATTSTIHAPLIPSRNHVAHVASATAFPGSDRGCQRIRRRKERPDANSGGAQKRVAIRLRRSRSGATRRLTPGRPGGCPPRSYPHAQWHGGRCWLNSAGASQGCHRPGSRSFPSALSAAATGTSNSGATGAGCRRGTTDPSASSASKCCAARQPSAPGPWSCPTQALSICPPCRQHRGRRSTNVIKAGPVLSMRTDLRTSSFRPSRRCWLHNKPYASQFSSRKRN